MLPKTDESLVYKMQVRDKACTICIHVDEPEYSEICNECIDKGEGKKPKWKNAHE